MYSSLNDVSPTCTIFSAISSLGLISPQTFGAFALGFGGHGSSTGDTSEFEQILIIFPAYTAQIGDQFIVAVEPVSEGSRMFNQTSRNSIFSIERFDEILGIINTNE